MRRRSRTTFAARLLCAVVGISIVATTPAGAATAASGASKPSSEERQIPALRTRIRQQSIDAYVAGSPDYTWSIYSAGSASDATNRRTLLEFRSTRSLDALEDFRTI